MSDTAGAEGPVESQSDSPLVSVVLICFDDHSRLPEAIASAREQSLAEIEIIIVDHGSTDGSVDVAQAAAAADPRIRVIALGDNDGKPGRPINAGMRAARAPWVTVFASDDLLRPRACELMLRTAEQYGADIVVGSLQRVNMDTGEMTRWMPGVTLRTRVISNVDQLPELIRDTTGGGKLYNTEFVRRHGLSFPEDIFYQDQVFTLEYYARAETVAVLSNFVLDWRHWPSGRQSVTQRRTTLENLSDRFAANERIDEFLKSRDRQDLLVLKQRKFLQHDLSIHVKDLEGSSQEYRDALVSRTSDYVAGFLPEAVVGLPLNKYLMLNCIRADRLAEAERITAIAYNRISAEWKRLSHDGRLFVVPPWAPERPDPVFDITTYRIDQTPERFRSARGQVAVTAKGSGFVFDVSLTSVGKAGIARSADLDLVLSDTLRGRRLVQRMKKQKGHKGFHVRWTAGVRAKDLDREFGGRPGPLDIMAVFDRGQPGQWSAQLHPVVDDTGDTPDAAEPSPAVEQLRVAAWTASVLESGVVVERDQEDLPAVRLDSLRSRWGSPPPSDDPDSIEVLSLSEARQYLRDSEIEPRLDTMFFESFAGRRIADGPLVVSRRLAKRRRRVRQHWSCTGWAQLDVPDHASAAPRFSRQYLDAMAESSVWFDNGWLPFRPGRGRRLVQLWHGSPVMRLPAEERQPGWSSVASSGDYFESCLAQTYPDRFRFIDAGAPRTDPLLDPVSAARRRADLRDSWGLRDRTVVLFSPALRDGEVSPAYRQPDLHRIAADLGPDYFWVHREHDDDATGRRTGSIADDLRWFAATPSGRVDICDYLLMADVLVSDYAPVISDFVLTGRPIIHYVTDQEFVEDVAPTTYFGLSEHAAGPIVGNDQDLVAMIRASAGHPSGPGAASYARHVAPLDARPSVDALLDWLEL